MKPKVLVTGGQGFLGSHLIQSLVRRGAEVTTLVQPGFEALPHLSPELRESVCVESFSLLDSDRLHALMRKQDRCFHLANQTQSGHDQDLVEKNVTATLNVLHAGLAHDCHLLLSSSSAVYGRPMYPDLDEQHPLQGRSTYAASCIAADMLAESFYHTFQLPVSVVRLFGLFGPIQGRAGLVPQIWLGRRCADTDLQVGLLYIEDAVDALIQVADGDFAGHIFNLGDEQGISLGALQSQIGAHAGAQQRVQDELRSKELRDRLPLAHCGKLQRALGWRPQYAPKAALQDTLAWYAQHPDFLDIDKGNILI